jgi:DNA replication protein DnaC
MLSNLIQYEALKRGKTCKRITQHRCYKDLMDNEMKNENDYNYRYPDFLFLDELGRTHVTDNSFREFFDLINYRYSQNKQTIITTNLKKGDLKMFMDEDRLKKFWTVEFKEESRR